MKAGHLLSALLIRKRSIPSCCRHSSGFAKLLLPSLLSLSSVGRMRTAKVIGCCHVTCSSLVFLVVLLLPLLLSLLLVTTPNSDVF